MSARLDTLRYGLSLIFVTRKVYITNGGKRNEIGIGLVNKGYSMGKHPGWEEFSYGYHGSICICFETYIAR